MSTTPFPLAPGARPIPVQDGAQPPAGLTLINPGDGGGTVLISAGPNGPITPLTAGAQMVWSDPAVYPYASLPAAATAAERVLVSDVHNYTNPVATAAALAAQGVPSVFLDRVLYDDTMASGAVVEMSVGGYASLTVVARWMAGTGPMSGGALYVQSSAPPVPPVLPPTIINYLTMDAAAEASAATWQLPVMADHLYLQNVDNPGKMPLRLSISGTNRIIPRLRQAGGEAPGITTVTAVPATGGTDYPLQATAGGSVHTRYNGPVALHYITYFVPGYLLAKWVDAQCNLRSVRFRITVTDGVIQWNHPAVPVHWSFVPDTTNAGASVSLSVIAG